MDDKSKYHCIVINKTIIRIDTNSSQIDISSIEIYRCIG